MFMILYQYSEYSIFVDICNIVYWAIMLTPEQSDSCGDGDIHIWDIQSWVHISLHMWMPEGAFVLRMTWRTTHFIPHPKTAAQDRYFAHTWRC